MHSIHIAAVLREMTAQTPTEPTEEEMTQLLASDFNLAPLKFGAFMIPANVIVQQPGEVCTYTWNLGSATWLEVYLGIPTDGDGGIRNVIYHGTPPTANIQYTIITHVTSNLGRDLTITSVLTIPPAEFVAPVYNNPPLITIQQYPAVQNGDVLVVATGTSPNGYNLTYSIVGGDYQYFAIHPVTGVITFTNAEQILVARDENMSLILLARDDGPYQLNDTAVVSIKVIA